MEALSREMSLAFDQLWNNLASDKAPGIEVYEKSLFLTLAQEDLVKAYFTPRGNTMAEGFDDSRRRQADFQTLISSKMLDTIDATDDTTRFRSSESTRYYQYPSEAFLVLNEELTVTADGISRLYTVVPVSYEEYARLMMRPYKYPPKGQVWRLLTHTGHTTGATVAPKSYQVLEIIGKFPASSALEYMMRYVRRPSPIVLDTLPTGLSVEGVDTESVCELPKHLHSEIVQRAVQLAKIAWLDPIAPQKEQS